MPLQNRMTPGGEIIAAPARGTFMGNRGILHDDARRLVRTARNSLWIICLLDFKGRRRQVMTPGRYTELFFLDEAVALAAGHRPCGECRRSAYRSYLESASAQLAEPIRGAKDLDSRLTASRRSASEVAALASLPDGTFVVLGESDFRLIWRGSLHRWTVGGYVDAVPLTELDCSAATVVTPSLSLGALRQGYSVTVHPSVSI